MIYIHFNGCKILFSKANRVLLMTSGIYFPFFGSIFFIKNFKCFFLFFKFKHSTFSLLNFYFKFFFIICQIFSSFYFFFFYKNFHSQVNVKLFLSMLRMRMKKKLDTTLKNIFLLTLKHVECVC